MRRSIRSFLLLCAGIVALVIPAVVGAQAADQLEAEAAPSVAPSPPPVFRATSRLVLLDVVVTDHRGEFVPGLKASDFTILEDGKPQRVSAFAVQLAPTIPRRSNPPVELPPHQYTNFSFLKQGVDRPVTVILMDMLNTTGMDQAYARKQMIQFLEKLPSGQPVSLFALTSKLSMIQGFSGDSGALLAAAKSLLRYQSPLLSPENQQQQEENLASAMKITGGSSSATGVAPITQAIHNALAAEDSFQQLERMGRTLSALNALARAVAGYPGRKNLIWLSAEFPVMFSPGVGAYGSVVNLQSGNGQTNNRIRDIENDSPPMHQTASLLAAVRMAVYPVDVRGMVSLGTGIDISAQTSYLGAAGIQNEASSAGQRQTTALWDAHEAMTDIARETGGRAFYGTNDLRGAMAHSMEQGSNYYTIAYTPTNHNWNGRYRKIEVKSATLGTQLTYRRGYYAFPEREMATSGAAAAMTGAMQPSVPEFTGLLLRVQVLPPDALHKNVQIDYAVDAHDLNFTDGADKRKHAAIEFVATAWDKDLKQVGRAADGMDATIRQDRYEQIMKTGLPFHQELELKPGIYNVRLGVLDRGSRKIGSVNAKVTVPEEVNLEMQGKSQ
jgi:VWFA-related protein